MTSIILKYFGECRGKCGENYFKILDIAPVGIDLKIKDLLHIRWQKPSPNKQIRQFNITGPYLEFFVSGGKLRTSLQGVSVYRQGF